MKTPPRTVLLVLCMLVLAMEWMVIASDYKDSVFLGTYHLEQGGESSNLTLRTDQTFQQAVTHDGFVRRCHGTWRRTGEGTISFSKDFIPLMGQEPGADGLPYGILEKSFGLFPAIALAHQHVLWYSRTDTSQGSSLAGTYAEDEAGVTAALVLREDRTFEQTVTRGGQTRHAYGTWKLRDDRDILFSREFLKASGEPLTEAETASACKPAGSNLQIRIAAAQSPAQPVFKKEMLSY